MFSRFVCRLRQFRRAMGAKPSAVDLRVAQTLLNEAQWDLFRHMAPRDQWHSVETLLLLRAAGHDDLDLAVAALLHDSGKGYVHLHERVLYVMLANSPHALSRAASPQGPHWRQALYRSARHAEEGARLALAAGSGKRVAELISQHHASPATDPALLALIDADTRS